MVAGVKGFVTENRSYILEAFQMAWPAVLESFFVAFAGMVDSLMVSTIGAYAVAAVGLTTQPKFIALAMFLAINVAVSAIVARRKGQDDRYGANQTLLLALLLVVVAGTLVSLAGVCFADPLIRLCGSAEDTHESAVLYFRIIVGGMMFNIISLVINAAQRGAGDVFFTTLASTFSVTIIRPLASYLFCYALGLGLMGIWLGVLGDQISRFVLTNWRFRSGAWAKIKI